MLFRNDLRICDNGALSAAARTGKPVVAAFVLDETGGGRPTGAASRWWLDQSLRALAASLDGLGLALVFRRTATQEAVDDLIEQTGADAVFWNRRYLPDGMSVDAGLRENLRKRGVLTESFEGHLLHHPFALQTAGGRPFRVYSPFWRALEQNIDPAPPLPAPRHLKAYNGDVRSEPLESWGLAPTQPDWAGGMRDAWTPGEKGAHERLERFVRAGIAGYASNRDIPGGATTSRLSAHLAHGEITPRQVWDAVSCRAAGADRNDVLKFRKEIAWREFAYHLLFQSPGLGTANFNSDFDHFPWNVPDNAFERWKSGQTGYPIVDAGMRELWQTGWMHNRVRMVAASFLVKHLLIDWRLGEAWFWDTLVDADPANNPAGWQWVAGSGADAAPYFRIFNPVLQGRKFDPDGRYVRKYVPEIADLPDKFIHSPWEAPPSVLAKAGIRPGMTYPEPIVDHAAARERALAAYNGMKERA